jgi:polyhydroxyalkanoate synthesis regulator phasin
VLVANAAEQFDEAGQLKSDETKKFVGDLLERLVEAAREAA